MFFFVSEKFCTEKQISNKLEEINKYAKESLLAWNTLFFHIVTIWKNYQRVIYPDNHFLTKFLSEDVFLIDIQHRCSASVSKMTQFMLCSPQYTQALPKALTVVDFQGCGA